MLDLTTHYKTLLEQSRLLRIERLLHIENKNQALLCYRLYNAYIREESVVDSQGTIQTVQSPHIVVFDMMQNIDDAKVHMVTDIKDVAISSKRNGTNPNYAAHANDNIIDTVADVYNVVKRIDRKKAV